MPISRLGPAGYGISRNGSFAGKTPDAGGGSGPHPVDRVTRLGAWGHDTRRTGSFAGKTPSSGGGSGPHPVNRITRLGMWGHNTQRAGPFAGKTSTTAVAPDLGLTMRRHRELEDDDEEVLLAFAAVLVQLTRGRK